ncbi:MAG TPA: type 1 fimbrial protein [Morganella sp. (in: Bacteria)]|nr:type 1 fimbrial protein [Morganella sp. (in: enterobacteria)]
MMKKKYHTGRVRRAGAICLLLIMCPLYAKADCLTPEPEIFLNPGINVAEVSDQLPLWAPIAGPFYSRISQGYHCTFSEEATVSFGIAAFGEKIGTTAEGHSVFYLAEGIGYSLGGEIDYPGCPATILYIDGRDSQGTDIDKILCRDAGVKNTDGYRGRVAVTLYKTGTTTADKIPEVPVAKFTLMKNNTWYPGIREPYVHLSGFTIRQRACDVSAPREIDLGRVSRMDFRRKGSVAAGSVREFTIGLQCSKLNGADIMLHGDDIQPGKITGTLRLNRMKNSAKGIGIQISRQGTAVTFNEWMLFDRVTTRDAQIRLQAALIQTKKNIQPGEAEAVLHYTIRYL